MNAIPHTSADYSPNPTPRNWVGRGTSGEHHSHGIATEVAIAVAIAPGFYAVFLD